MEKADETKTGAKCTVKTREITLDHVQAILKKQRDMVTTNNREKGQGAFDKTLSGSKEYLKYNGLI